jgi:hypothetical protein
VVSTSLSGQRQVQPLVLPTFGELFSLMGLKGVAAVWLLFSPSSPQRVKKSFKTDEFLDDSICLDFSRVSGFWGFSAAWNALKIGLP